MEEERIESYSSYPSCTLTCEQSETSDSHLIDHDNQDLLHTSLSTENDGNTSNTNDHDFQNENERKTSLKFLIVEMVLDAMKLTKKHECSAAVFDDVLTLARKLITNASLTDIDNDLLEIMWPSNWNQAEKILQECGYTDAKKYYVCYCYTEVETTRNGKTFLKKNMMATGTLWMIQIENVVIVIVRAL